MYIIRDFVSNINSKFFRMPSDRQIHLGNLPLYHIRDNYIVNNLVNVEIL